MSVLIQAHLLDRYGPRLTLPQVAEALGLAEGTVRNMHSTGELDFMRVEGGKVFADVRDLAPYIQEIRDAARHLMASDGPQLPVLAALAQRDAGALLAKLDALPTFSAGRYPGVYLLLLDGEIVYVGKSRHIVRRVATHISLKPFQFDAFRLLPLPEDAIDAAEKALIAALQPRNNVVGVRKCE